MNPQDVLKQYLEGAITFAEFIGWIALYHSNRETVAASLPEPICANCGSFLASIKS